MSSQTISDPREQTYYEYLKAKGEAYETTYGKWMVTFPSSYSKGDILDGTLVDGKWKTQVVKNIQIITTVENLKLRVTNLQKLTIGENDQVTETQDLGTKYEVISRKEPSSKILKEALLVLILTSIAVAGIWGGWHLMHGASSSMYSYLGGSAFGAGIVFGLATFCVLSRLAKDKNARYVVGND